MTDEQVTQLSALMDGELASHHTRSLQQALGGDPGLRATWERYHLIGQALRGEGVRREVRNVAVVVRAQLGSAPLCSPVRVACLRSTWWRAPSAGAALAAAAALAAVFAVPGVTWAPRPRPAVVGAPPGAALAGRRWETERTELVGKLDRFVLSHEESVPSGMRGMLPYATLVGYEAGR